MAIEFRVPSLGDATTATIGRWLKKVGDPIADGEVVVELETDQLTAEIESPGNGVLTSITADKGTTLRVGQVLFTIEANAGRVRESPQRIFIVHGHDDAAREAVARLVERAGLEAVILREQPNQGRTIIEKFEQHSETADFAIVLLTPDDVGGPRGSALKQLQPRARQNVVAELFFFIGKLGRSKVCALVKGSIELPSDFAGVVYEQMDDAGHWRLALAQEMQSAGLTFDLNKVFHR